jgi:hypothetical protein
MRPQHHPRRAPEAVPGVVSLPLSRRGGGGPGVDVSALPGSLAVLGHTALGTSSSSSSSSSPAAHQGRSSSESWTSSISASPLGHAGPVLNGSVVHLPPLVALNTSPSGGAHPLPLLLHRSPGPKPSTAAARIFGGSMRARASHAEGGLAAVPDTAAMADAALRSAAAAMLAGGAGTGVGADDHSSSASFRPLTRAIGTAATAARRGGALPSHLPIPYHVVVVGEGGGEGLGEAAATASSPSPLLPLLLTGPPDSPMQSRSLVGKAAKAAASPTGLLASALSPPPRGAAHDGAGAGDSSSSTSTSPRATHARGDGSLSTLAATGSSLSVSGSHIASQRLVEAVASIRAGLETSPPGRPYDPRHHLYRTATALMAAATDSDVRPHLPAPILSLLELVAEEIRVAADSAVGQGGGGGAEQLRSHPFPLPHPHPSRSRAGSGSGAAAAGTLTGVGSALLGSSLALSSTLGGSTLSLTLSDAGTTAHLGGGGGLAVSTSSFDDSGQASSRGPTPSEGASGRPSLALDLGATSYTILTVPVEGTSDISATAEEGQKDEEEEDEEEEDFDGFAEYAGPTGGGAGEEGIRLEVIPSGHARGNGGGTASSTPHPVIPPLSLPVQGGPGGGGEGGEGGGGPHGPPLVGFHEEFMAQEMSETWRAEAEKEP